MVALVAVRFVAVKFVTVEDVNVKLLIVALVAVKLVTVQLVPSKVATVPAVADRSEAVRVVTLPLTAVKDCALLMTALLMVLSLSVAGMSALTSSRNVEFASPPLVGPAYTELAGTGAITSAVPQLYAPLPPDTNTCPIEPTEPKTNSEPLEYAIAPGTGDNALPVPPRPIGSTPVISDVSDRSTAG